MVHVEWKGMKVNFQITVSKLVLTKMSMKSYFISGIY